MMTLQRGWLAAMVASLLMAPLWMPSLASAELTSFAGLVASNFENSDFGEPVDDAFSNTGALVTANGTASYTGMNSFGSVETMTFSGRGRAQAQYGRLRTFASGTISNTYFNPDNEPLVDSFGDINPDGSPTNLQAFGQATWTDTLQYGGFSAGSGYGARYGFRITGNFSGDAESVFHTLGITIAGNRERYTTENTSPGRYFDLYTTDTYPVNGTTPQTVEIQILSSFGISPETVEDGSRLSGSADFFNTVDLIAVDLVDPAGEVVPRSEWTLVTGSGTDYRVPEPATIGLVLASLAMAAVRRR